jgi:hypothetical protein
MTSDTATKLAAASTRECRLYWARILVDERFAAGAYPVLQVLTADVREAMALALVRECEQLPEGPKEGDERG